MGSKSTAFIGIDIFGFVFIISLFKYNSKRKYKNGFILPILNNDIYIAIPCCTERV